MIASFLPFVVVGLFVWLNVDEKSYSFPEVRIDATVLPDGSIRLVEHRTYEFDGEFSFAFFTVAEPPANVLDFEVREDGRTLPVTRTSEFGHLKARWEFSARDERRTFRISYRVTCAVEAFRDGAHLEWQFVGTGWEVPTDHLLVRVHLPEAATRPLERPPACLGHGETSTYPSRPLEEGQTRTWGHGPLSGEVRILDPQTVELEVRDVPPFTFVEGSILFPKRAVPRAAVIPIERRAGILAQERTLAEQANEERRRLLAEERARERWTTVAWVLVFVAPLVYLGLVAIARIRDRVPGVPRLLQDPPEDLHPMQLAQLWGAYRGAVNPQDAYRTQLLHLASTGVIEMRGEGLVSDPEDIEVRLRDIPADGSLDLEFTEFLFVDGQEWVSLKSITPKGKRKSELKEWWTKAKNTGKAGFRSVRQNRWESIVTTLLGLAGIIVSIGLLGLAGVVGLLVMAEVVVGMIVAHVLIPSRPTPEFRERIARWAAFRRFLKRFSSLPEAPALAVVIWERYLVYATALGVADQVEKQVKAHIPAEELPAPWPGAPGGIHSIAWVHTFHDSTPSQVASWVMPRASSSSGGSFSSGGGFGGGFSGGGGGGGGGTGGGAG